MAQWLEAVRRLAAPLIVVAVIAVAGWSFLLRSETVDPHLRQTGPTSHSALQQARVIRAAPSQLRPYIESASYDEGGVDVMLKAGIELRFGDASQVVAKWKAAAAVLANPSITTLDYVDVQVPSHPVTGGSGYTLPSLP